MKGVYLMTKDDWNELYKKAKYETTTETLPLFLVHLHQINQKHPCYDTACKTAVAGAIATIASISGSFGGLDNISGGDIIMEFILAFGKQGNKAGVVVTDYDCMLFPQYDYMFTTITKETWQLIQQEAVNWLKQEHPRSRTHPAVLTHWKSIAAGNVPFGYTIKEDK